MATTTMKTRLNVRSFYSLYFLFMESLFEHDHPCSEMWPCQQKTLRTVFRARPSLVEW